jgi:hypothetical protein
MYFRGTLEILLAGQWSALIKNYLPIATLDAVAE